MFSDFIDHLIKEGKCCFNHQDAMSNLGKSKKAVQSSIEHLLAKNELVSPVKGFYVILPPEYRKLGCLPAAFFLPYLMEHLGLNYYVGLLSAAAYYGASHQALQVCQVMIKASRVPLTCGEVKIKFIAKKNLDNTITQTFNTPKSIVKVSSPEETLIDILNYIPQSGGLNHIATIINELYEVIDQAQFKKLIDEHPLVPWKQRLGYILDQLGLGELSTMLKDSLSLKKRVDYIPLSPSVEHDLTSTKNNKWKIIENTTIESDL